MSKLLVLCTIMCLCANAVQQKYSWGEYEQYRSVPSLVGNENQLGYNPNPIYRRQYDSVPYQEDDGFPNPGNRGVLLQTEQAPAGTGTETSAEGSDASATPEASDASSVATASSNPTPIPASTGSAVLTPAQTSSSPASSSSDSPSSSSSSTNSDMDELDLQLQAALDAVIADMISKGKQVLAEKQWTVDVQAVIDEYKVKIQNVFANIEKLKADMKALYIKKKQIENAQYQKKLGKQLRDAQGDLATVTEALQKIENTNDQFKANQKDIQDTIDAINAQLAELQGKATTKSTSADSSTDTDSDSAGASDDTSSSSSKSSSESSSDGGDDSSDAGPSDQDIVDKKDKISTDLDAIKQVIDGLKV